MRQTSVNRPALKADPLSGLHYVGGFVVIGSIAGAVWVVFSRSDIFTCIALLVIALLGAALFWYLSPWAPVEKCRQSAASQANALAIPLAAEQPVPDETALSLPCKIKLRPKWKIPIICFCVLIPLTGGPLFLYMNMAPTNPPEPDWAPLATIGISAGSSIFISALTALIPLCAGWQTIKVTERGIKVQESSLKSMGCNLRTIEWDEARLFAIYPTRKRNDLTMYYELADETAIVRWRRMLPGRQSPVTKTPIPFEEYDRQMDALLSVIAAKTGLPLYDLR